MSTEKPFVLIRSMSAGVFAGYLVSKKECHDTAKYFVELEDTIRIWYWAGAFTLSDVAMNGVTKPDDCKFPTVIKGVHSVGDVIEIIPTTEKARISLQSVEPLKI